MTYNGTTYSVTSVGSFAFENCSGLTEVTIPTSVTSIGEGVFSNCSNIEYFYGKFASEDHKSLIVDGKLISIALSGLTSFEIPNGVTSIGSYVFYGCTGLTEVTIPNSVTEIGKYAFYNCTSLTGVTIPNSVASIGESVFQGCRGLTEITIPNSVTSIGESVFQDCRGLTAITIPNSVTSIGNYAFYNCSGLTEVTIPNSVTTIGGSAFSGCTGLTEVTITNSVTSIGSFAFDGCTGLTEVSIPNSVTSIYSGAFENCTGIKNLIIVDGETQLNLYWSSSSPHPFKGCGIENLYVGRNLSDWKVFNHSENLKEVTIGDSVTTITEFAFQGCTGLTEIVIPNSVTSIEKYALSQCPNLKSVSLSSSVTSLEEGLFWQDYALEEISIPGSVTSIGKSALIDCTGLKALRIEDSETQLSVYDSNSNYYPFKGCNVENLYVGRNLSSWEALCNTVNLRSVTLGSGLTSIPSQAFANSPAYKIVALATEVPTGLASAFSNIEGRVAYVINDKYSDTSVLGRVVVSENVTRIVKIDGVSYLPITSGRTAIAIDADLSVKSVQIPESVKVQNRNFSVTEIGQNLFRENPQIDYVTFPSTVKTIKPYAFAESSVKYMSVPANVETIESSAFRNCNDLIDFRIEESESKLTITGDKILTGTGIETFTMARNLDCSQSVSPFMDLTSVTTATVGEKVTTLPDNAFSGCSSMLYIYSYATVPPVCGEDAFNYIDKDNCWVYVPMGCEDAYIDAPQWEDFWNIEGFDTTNVDTIATEQTLKVSNNGGQITISGAAEGEPVAIYNLMGQRLYMGNASEGSFTVPVSLSRGEIYIVVVGTRTFKYRK